MYLVDVDRECGAVGKPVTAGGTHIDVPGLAARGQQAHLLDTGHGGHWMVILGGDLQIQSKI